MVHLKNFNFRIPQNIVFGMGALNQLSDILKTGGNASVYLISDRGLKSAGVVDRVAKLITEAGITCHEYLDVLPNPTVDMVNAATEGYLQSGADSIIALGGGSPMDVAKAVGVLATYGGAITDYVGFQKVPGPIMPIIAIPTTAGTGSEVTASSVITDEASNFKMAVISYDLIPQHAILDPALVMTLPASVAAACGIDAFIHAEEAYVSKMANPFTDAMAEKAMELIGANIRRFIASRDDEEAACAMMLGCTFAGLAFAWAKLGNVHAMSHPVSGFFHVAHGVANAILLPTIVEYNALADKGRYLTIYNYIAEKRVEKEDFEPGMLAEELRSLNRDLGIPASLSEVGVTADKIPLMALDAMKSGNVAVNPRQTVLKDVEALYHKAF